MCNLNAILRLLIATTLPLIVYTKNSHNNDWAHKGLIGGFDFEGAVKTLKSLGILSWEAWMPTFRKLGKDKFMDFFLKNPMQFPGLPGFKHHRKSGSGSGSSESRSRSGSGSRESRRWKSHRGGGRGGGRHRSRGSDSESREKHRRKSHKRKHSESQSTERRISKESDMPYLVLPATTPLYQDVDPVRNTNPYSNVENSAPVSSDPSALGPFTASNDNVQQGRSMGEKRRKHKRKHHHKKKSRKHSSEDTKTDSGQGASAPRWTFKYLKEAFPTESPSGGPASSSVQQEPSSNPVPQGPQSSPAATQSVPENPPSAPVQSEPSSMTASSNPPANQGPPNNVPAQPVTESIPNNPTPAPPPQ